MTKHSRHKPPVMVVTVALLIVGLVLALVLGGTQNPRDKASPNVSQGILALMPPPPVPPSTFEDQTQEVARASNAAVPLHAGDVTAPPRFRFAGTTADRDAAEACLTAAVLFEAGDDPPGEKAVAQVVLNRVRHPAFPKTVCGVVLQGSERKTGCQFTFTCDGSLFRRPSAPAWKRARDIADAALAGAAYTPVGTATHYHTDWVVPYWRSELEKIAIVHTQIFYRWPGRWGSRAALTGRLEPGERVDPRIAEMADLRTLALSPMAAEAAAQPVPPAQTVAGVPVAQLHGSIVRLKDEDGGLFVVQLAADAAPGSYAAMAFNLCGAKLECTVYGWARVEDVPRTLPILPWMLKSLAFAYRKSNTLGLAQAYWDCQRYPRAVKGECLAD